MAKYLSDWRSDDAEGIYRFEPAGDVPGGESVRLQKQPGGLLASVLNLDAVEGAAREIAREWLRLSQSSQALSLDLGDGEKCYEMHTDIPATPRTCVEMLAAIQAVRSLVKEIANCEISVVMGVCLGRVWERLCVLEFEPLVKRQKLKISKARSQAETTNKKRAAKRPDYGKAVKNIMRKQRIKYTPACKAVAEQFDVTPETVRNNTPELRPGEEEKVEKRIRDFQFTRRCIAQGWIAEIAVHPFFVARD